MDKNEKAGNPGDTAPGTEGKKPDNTSTGDAGNVSATASEQAAKIADLEARLAKESKDKEVYRAGLLAAKDLGKKPKRLTAETIADPEALESIIDAKIQDRDLEQKLTQDTERKLQEDETLRRENEELRRSLDAAQTAGFSGGYGSGSGHNENSVSKPSGYWSDQQRADLVKIYESRAMYSPDQIKTMVVKAEEIARTKTAQSARSNDVSPKRRY